MDNYIFWSDISSGFGKPGGTPPPRIPRSTSPVGMSACVQTSLLPQEKSGEDDGDSKTCLLPIFSEEGGRLYTGYANANSASMIKILPNQKPQEIDAQ